MEGGTVDTKKTPIVGLVATTDNTKPVLGTIIRAQSNNYPVAITANKQDLEVLELAREHDAVIVWPDAAAPDETSPQEGLAKAARSAGFPGLLYHDNPEVPIDFEASLNRLYAGDQYATEAVPSSRVDSGPEIMAAIPAHNEERTISSVVKETKAVADEVLVIDDGSSDSTAQKAKKAGATTISHETNQGYGGALKTGFKEAKRADADYLVVLDGDGQHKPQDISKLVNQQQRSDADIVIGSRFGNSAETDLPLYRRFGLFVINVLTNISLGIIRKQSRIKDTQSGFRAYSSRAIETLAEDDSIGDNMGASTDVLYHAHKNGYSTEEVGTTIDYNVEDANNQNPVSHGLTLINNILRTIERERPVTVLGIPGVFSSIIGIGFAYWTIINYLNTNSFALELSIISIFFTLAGIFSAFTAIILHSLETHRS
ncbi:glycosyltransferase family 2 protein [Haloarcula laminariae]|uniref:glycosyltransferase family 2 protein n=1 Tax=Haloarcula laminariae TaxID=2961577 RepID=UPI0024061B1F|nr:glycosyltransferase family 2 protein [Halomicroarcula sp. FL173]